jgi:hypothetical protein
VIKQNRLQHILGVARKCKEYAIKLKPNDRKFAEDMFLLGMLHDIGYEFIENNELHACIGGEILKRSGYKYWQEVSAHGDETIENMSDELFILNCADISIGPNGEEFTFDERLSEIASRFGKEADAYKKCVVEVKKLKTDKRYITLIPL